MRYESPLGLFTGTPEEIAEAIRHLREAGLLPAATPEAPLVVQVAQRASPHGAELRAAPSNELLLYEYQHDPGISRGVRAARLSAAQDFERSIAPKSLLDATDDDVRRWERTLIDLACKHLQFRGTRGQTQGIPQLHCRAGKFTWTPARPAMCNASCPLFQRQATGPRARLGHLKAFYEFVRSRRLRADNPVEFVLKRHKRGRRSGLGKHKYAPTLDEIRQLTQTLRTTGTLADVALLMALAKWGRRPSHTVLLDASELVGILHDDPDGHAFADFSGVLQRVLDQNEDGGSKLANGYLISPIDHEYKMFLRNEYLPWRQARWGYAWNEGPLFPGTRGQALNDQLIQERLNAAMQHRVAHASDEASRERWHNHHRVGSKSRITPGCFRHFLTTTLEEYGVSREDRKVLRGDAITDALEDYRHLTPAKICQKYPSNLMLLEITSR